MSGKDVKKEIRLGFVGVGDQGSTHLDIALGMPGVEVAALCDVDDGYLFRAKKWVEEAGQPTPRLYGTDKEAYKRLCREMALDAVVVSTAWPTHASICLEAMKHEKHAICEVPIALSVEEAWAIVEAYESTGYWATMGYKPVHSALLNMVSKGMFGKIVSAEAGYVHDLRLVKFDPEREPWRLQHSVDRNGNLYPDHPTTWVMPLFDINRGDRFAYLVSMSSRACSLNEYAAHYYGEQNYYAKAEMKQGDYNATLIRTVKGKVFNLVYDTNTPHPRCFYRLQGTKGTFLRSKELGDRIYLDGISPENHRWERAEPYLTAHEHPLVAAYDPPERPAIRGHSGGSRKTPYYAHRAIAALQEGRVTDLDVYDSVTSSVISPLTERSVAEGTKPVEFPDFTRGKWESRPSWSGEEAR